MWEAVVAKECLTSHIPTLKTLSDMLTKVLFGQKRRNLVQVIMYDIYDHDRNDRALQLVKRVRWTLDWFDLYFTGLTDTWLCPIKSWISVIPTWGECVNFLPLCFRYASKQRRYKSYLWEPRHVRMDGARSSTRHHRKCVDCDLIFDHNLSDNNIDN